MVENTAPLLYQNVEANKAKGVYTITNFADLYKEHNKLLIFFSENDKGAITIKGIPNFFIQFDRRKGRFETHVINDNLFVKNFIELPKEKIEFLREIMNEAQRQSQSVKFKQIAR